MVIVLEDGVLQSVRALLDHLRKAVGDGERRVDETLHAANETSFRSGVQLGARFVHALIPANIRKVVNLSRTINTVKTQQAC